MKRPRLILGRRLPANCDPAYRFVARYVLQAVLDAIWPTKQVELHEYRTAYIFVLSNDGRAMINALGIPHRILRPQLQSLLPAGPEVRHGQ